MISGSDLPVTAASNEIAKRKMPAQQPIVIRGGGTTRAVSTWMCTAALAGLLLLAAMHAHPAGGLPLLAAALATFSAAMLLYTAALGRELKDDEISYAHFFRRRRSLRLDQIRSVRGTWRSSKGGVASYLVIEPMDPTTPSMKMRMDFFSHADAQTIRNYFGDKLKRYAKKK